MSILHSFEPLIIDETTYHFGHLVPFLIILPDIGLNGKDIVVRVSY